MRTILIICSVFAITGWASQAEAQFNNSAFNPARGYRGPNRSSRSSLINNSTVSPYLALTDLTGQGFDLSSNYFTNVRPRIESQRQQQQQARQLQLIQRDISQTRSEAARRSQNGPSATGHPTRFGLYMQYFPGLR